MPNVPGPSWPAAGRNPAGVGQNVPAFDETRGGTDRLERQARAILDKGEQAVAAATDAVAAQIGATVARIAKAVEQQTALSLNPATSSVESVEVSFGITLTMGLTTVFTAQGESSVQVTVSLSPKGSQPAKAAQ
jgi:hypothetical protein